VDEEHRRTAEEEKPGLREKRQKKARVKTTLNSGQKARGAKKGAKRGVFQGRPTKEHIKG